MARCARSGQRAPVGDPLHVGIAGSDPAVARPIPLLLLTPSRASLVRQGDKVYRDGTFEGSWRGKDGIDFIDGAVQEKVTALAALINSTNARFIEFAGQVADLALGGFGFDGKGGKE